MVTEPNLDDSLRREGEADLAMEWLRGQPEIKRLSECSLVVRSLGIAEVTV